MEQARLPGCKGSGFFFSSPEQYLAFFLTYTVKQTLDNTEAGNIDKLVKQARTKNTAVATVTSKLIVKKAIQSRCSRSTTDIYFAEGTEGQEVVVANFVDKDIQKALLALTMDKTEEED